MRCGLPIPLAFKVMETRARSASGRCAYHEKVKRCLEGRPLIVAPSTNGDIQLVLSTPREGAAGRWPTSPLLAARCPMHKVQ